MERPLTQNIRPDGEPLDLRRVRAGRRLPGAAQGALEHDARRRSRSWSRTRTCAGRGGAGFPTGAEVELRAAWAPTRRGPSTWSSTPTRWSRARSRTACCWRATRTSSSRAMIIAAYAIEADVAYIFLRWEYRLAAERLAQGHRRGLRRRATWARTSWARGYQPRAAPAHRAPAATCAARRPALLNALEGKRANPRAKPPFPQVVRPVGQADDRQQRRDALQRPAHRQQRRRTGSRA